MKRFSQLRVENSSRFGVEHRFQKHLAIGIILENSLPPVLLLKNPASTNSIASETTCVEVPMCNCPLIHFNVVVSGS